MRIATGTLFACRGGQRLRKPSAMDGPIFERLERRKLLSFDPTAQEQQSLELLNRMRQDPADELPLLINSGDKNVDAGLTVFGVNRTQLAAQWGSLVPAAPLAWSDQLAQAADAHNRIMLDTDTQTHQAPGEFALGQRLVNAGYNSFSLAGENVYAYAKSTFHSHAAFAIDWGDGPGGIQNPPDHRDNMMDRRFREVGISIIKSTVGKTTGPLLITQDLGVRPGQGNPFLVGVAYYDRNVDGSYTAGEGLAHVNIQVSGTGGTFNTTTMTAGGYQLQVPEGTYTVRFSGPGVATAVTRSVTVGLDNAKVDLKEPLTAANAPRFSTAGANAIAYTPGGRLYLAWYDTVHRALMAASRNGNGVWTAPQTVDHRGKVGSYLSMATDKAGRPGIAYYDATNKDLKYAHLFGSRWSISTVAHAGKVGLFPSLAYDSAGHAGISFYDEAHLALKFATLSNHVWSLSTVDNTNNSGRSSSAGIDASTGHWAVAYSRDGDSSLRYATLEDSGWVNHLLAQTVGAARSISLQTINDLPSISFDDTGANTLYYLIYDHLSTVKQTVAVAPNLAGVMVVDPTSGDPLVIYHDPATNTVYRADGSGASWASTKLLAGILRPLSAAESPTGHISYTWLHPGTHAINVEDL